MAVELSRAVRDGLIAQAEAAHPNECCGILLGDGVSIFALMPARNIHPHPQRHFEIDPQALIDAHRAARTGGPQVLGYYHSHPSGVAEPSATDRRQAPGDGRIWAIAARGELRIWRNRESGFEPLSYVVR